MGEMRLNGETIPTWRVYMFSCGCGGHVGASTSLCRASQSKGTYFAGRSKRHKEITVDHVDKTSVAG